MKRNITKKYGTFEIAWIIRPPIPLKPGPGVEFHYKNERGILIGLIEGYEWQRKNSGFCKIITLR